MTVQFQLEKVLQLHGNLGSPAAAIPAFIHVGGVLGKTSVALFLTRLLNDCTTLRIGTFVHPYISMPRDCIRVGEEVAEEAVFNEYMRHVNQMDEIFRTQCSFYEKLFLVALLTFKTMGCDLIVVEASLGGTFEATNILHHKEFHSTPHQTLHLVTVITHIAYDHPKYLGPDLPSVTQNIANLCSYHTDKDNSTSPFINLISSDQHQSVLQQLNSMGIQDSSSQMSPNITSKFLIRMPPHQQTSNMELALRAFQRIIPKIEQTFSIKCRQPLSGVFATLHFPFSFAKFHLGSSRVIVDAAQNEDSTFCHWIRNQNIPSGSRVHLILGMGVKDDEITGRFLQSLGIRREYRYTIVDIQAPVGYPWITPHQSQPIIDILINLYRRQSIEIPEINYEPSLSKVLENVLFNSATSQDLLTVILGSPHIVRDFYSTVNILHFK